MNSWNGLRYLQLRTLAMVGWLAMGGVAAAQINQYSIGSTSTPQRVEIVVVDRCQLPVVRASVSIRATYMADNLSQELVPYAVSLETEQLTGPDGEIAFNLEPGEIAAALIERTGYAPLVASPLFGGHRYKVVLDLGRGIRAWCPPYRETISGGGGYPDSGIRMDLYLGPARSRLQAHLLSFFYEHPIRSLILKAPGLAEFEHLPRGNYELRTSAEGAAFSRPAFQISSGYGNEVDIGSDLAPVLRDWANLSLSVTDLQGLPVESFRAAVDSNPPSMGPVEWAQGAGGRVQFSGVDLEAFAGFTVEAAGFARKSVSALDFNGRRLPVPNVIQLEPLTGRTLEFDAASVLGLDQQTKVLVPSTITRRQLFFRFEEIIPSDGVYRVENVEDGIDVFAFLLRSNRVDGFLTVSDAGEVVSIKPGALEVTYSVGGYPPQSMGIRFWRTHPAEGAEQPCFGLEGRRMGILDPEGVVRFSGLLPGTYRLEPHFHYSVFGDAIAEVEIAPGRTTKLELNVRRGKRILVEVVDQEGQPVAGGTVEIRSPDTALYIRDTRLEVGRDGHLQIGGIDPNGSYRLIYHPPVGVNDHPQTSGTATSPSAELAESRLDFGPNPPDTLTLSVGVHGGE